MTGEQLTRRALSRQERKAAAIIAAGRVAYGERYDDQAVLTDILTDLMHYAARPRRAAGRALDFDRALVNACEHFTEERGRDSR
jgi:hypothetical protein